MHLNFYQEIETISLDIGRVARDFVYKEIVKTKGDRLARLRIQITARDKKDDCSARIELWTTHGWVALHAIIPACMKTPTTTDRISANIKEPFAEDRAELLRVGAEILNLGEIITTTKERAT